MNHEIALIEMQYWAWEEKMLYLFSCLFLLSFIGIMFWRSKQ